MKTIEELRDFILLSCPEEEVYLFGSRARGDNTPHSDIDIAIDGDHDLSAKLSRLRFEIEESQIPYKVDLIDLSKAPYLKDIICQEGTRWH